MYDAEVAGRLYFAMRGIAYRPATSAAAGKEPKRTLADALKEPGNDLAYMALMKIQRAWNMLDNSGDFTIRVHDSDSDSEGSIERVPVFYATGERKKMLRLMQEVIQKGESSYGNPFGADDTETLLDAFAELSANQKRCLFKLCQQSVKKRASLGKHDLVAVLSAK